VQTYGEGLDQRTMGLGQAWGEYERKIGAHRGKLGEATRTPTEPDQAGHLTMRHFTGPAPGAMPARHHGQYGGTDPFPPGWAHALTDSHHLTTELVTHEPGSGVGSVT
jgi:hypothetical protein